MGGAATALRSPAPLDPLLDLLACPGCHGGLALAGSSLECERCATRYGIEDGIPNLRCGADRRTEAVRDFYGVAPFPGYRPRETLSSLRARAGRSEFAQLLDQAIPPLARVLEVGCGTGQMSLFLATRDRLVLGVDLTRASLGLAADAARRFEVHGAYFVETDLRSPGIREGQFDVVYCSGVLHHTPNPAASFANLARLVRVGGVIVLGLYNAYARFPHRLRRAVARMTRFRVIPFDPVLRDRMAEPERRQAWLRDQYQHPEEHRHTLREVQRWFARTSIEYLRTYPSCLIGEEIAATDLFSPAGDNWGPENVLAQLGWAFSLSHEGGLWVTIGQRTDGPRT